MALFLSIIQLIPSIIRLVRQIEELVPQPAQGAAKLNFVLDSVNSIAVEIPELATSTVPLQKAIAGIVAASVTMFNQMGVFRKS